MSLRDLKTEHGGPKHAHGAWTTKADAKTRSKELRRVANRREVQRGLAELPPPA